MSYCSQNSCSFSTPIDLDYCKIITNETKRLNLSLVSDFKTVVFWWFCTILIRKFANIWFQVFDKREHFADEIFKLGGNMIILINMDT